MHQREQFAAAVATGETSVAECCRQYGISRKTGYKWLARLAADPAGGAQNRSRAPHHVPHAVSQGVRETVLALRARHPTWGPKKLVAALRAQDPATRWPAASTVGDLLRHAGLVVPRQPRRHAPLRSTPLAHATGPNAVWCIDFKGDFLLGDGSRCYPLTVSDAASRYLLRCQALPATGTARVQPLLAATFREYGLPTVLRSDNGPPFASVGLAGLTPLSVWWLKLGIQPERITPGKPAENGRHERLHRTLKAEACQPPAATRRAQQQRFDHFVREYNTERPHEALGQTPPAQVYTPSVRPFPERLPDLTYPTADAIRWVRPNGAIHWRQADCYLTTALVGEPVGLTQVGDARWQVCYGPLVLGVFDTHERQPRLRPGPPRASPRRHRGSGSTHEPLLPMSPV